MTRSPWRAVEALTTGNVCHDNDDDCEVTVGAHDDPKAASGQGPLSERGVDARIEALHAYRREHGHWPPNSLYARWEADVPQFQITYDPHTGMDYEYVELGADLDPYLAEGWEVTPEPSYPNTITLQRPA